MADVGESLDFDFFETPRTTDEVASSPVNRSKPPVRPQSAKPSKFSPGRDRSRSRSPSSRGSSPGQSISDLSDSDHSPARDSKKKPARSPSISSFSSSNRSRSRSPSISKDRSRSASNDSFDSKYSKESGSDDDAPLKPSSNAQRITVDMPKRGASRLGEDEYSSSAYSDEDSYNSRNVKKSPPSRKNQSNGREESSRSGGKKQAWGDQNVSKFTKTSNGTHKARPTTAKNRSHGSERDRRSGRGARSDSDALSDSDMTDVSPMESPRRVEVSGSGDNSSARPRFRAMPVAAHDVDQEDMDYNKHSSKGALDLEILMKAVGELEKQKRLQANSRRVMFAPMTLKRGDKSNYTFDKNQTRDIERENQRLLKEIVQQVQSSGKRQRQVRSAPASAYKLTASAVNRDREMKRIENENMALLKRLQKVKPTKTISRDNQIQSYESTQLHGVPIGALHPMPARKSSSRAGRRSVLDDTSSIGSRTRSMTSINSGTSTVRSRPNSRPGSATKRLDTRPIWSDRW